MSTIVNRIRSVAMVGAGGNSGRHMAEALLATGKHTITAITRPGSQSVIPTGVRSAVVGSDEKNALVAALRGHDAFIITLPGNAGSDVHRSLVEAAATAGVSWILPNEWGVDTTDEVDPGLLQDLPAWRQQQAHREHIRSLGASYVGISTGFWYEWSLSSPIRFGFDFTQKKATFYDNGETKMSLSTWPQVGRAVASLLSLPISSEDGPCLNDFRNKQIYVNSFTVTQKDMLDSILRVTGDKADSWVTENVPSSEMFRLGGDILKTGSRSGFIIQGYSRMFYPEREVGNTEKTHGLVNDALGLNQESIDDATRAAIELVKKLDNGARP
ncbi:hypothetical protein BKA62DRAFT_656646 [Auriculariales sp. MPI-PUGE-AT-0066]|nr:hypothetical protein BKA62DRAFT_656646 [Auriculariales sp. MPI-PUGE-AT-0066]